MSFHGVFYPTDSSPSFPPQHFNSPEFINCTAISDHENHGYGLSELHSTVTAALSETGEAIQMEGQPPSCFPFSLTVHNPYAAITSGSSSLVHPPQPNGEYSSFNIGEGEKHEYGLSDLHSTVREALTGSGESTLMEGQPPSPSRFNFSFAVHNPYASISSGSSSLIHPPQRNGEFSSFNVNKAAITAATTSEGIADELQMQIQSEYLQADPEGRRAIYNEWVSRLRSAANNLTPTQMELLQQQLDVNSLQQLNSQGKQEAKGNKRAAEGEEDENLHEGTIVPEKKKKRTRRRIGAEMPGSAEAIQLARLRKSKMSFPKGTFIIRLADVAHRDGRDHVWWIDNHQLLLRYNLELMSLDGKRVYVKTDRYTGWLCDEPWNYLPLKEGHEICSSDENKVTLVFPSEEKLREALMAREEQKAKRAEEKENEEEVHKNDCAVTSEVSITS